MLNRANSGLLVKYNEGAFVLGNIKPLKFIYFGLNNLLYIIFYIFNIFYLTYIKILKIIIN